MCFYLNVHNKKRFPKPLIAEKDIICYKILDKKTINNKRCFVSPYYYQKYNINETVGVGKFGKMFQIDTIFDSNGKKIPDNYFEIHEGLHSFKSYKEAKSQNTIFFGMTTSVRKFIIPKGTKYYENDIEYVSLALKRIT